MKWNDLSQRLLRMEANQDCILQGQRSILKKLTEHRDGDQGAMLDIAIRYLKKAALHITNMPRKGERCSKK
jgi:hypothetical protein